MSGALAAAPHPLGKILRAEEAGLYQDAAGALAAAREAAECMLAEARRVIAEERGQVLAKVRAEAEAEAGRMLATTAAAAQQALAALPAELAEAIADGVARVVGSLDLADAVAHAARCALDELTERNGLVVRVPPTAVAAVRTQLAPWGQGVRVVADLALPPDGCVLETRAGFVRAGLQEQLGILAASLRRAAAPG